MTSYGRRTDTTDAAAAIYVESYTSLTGDERVQRSIEMAEEVKQITLAGIAHRAPSLSAEEIHLEWLRILHGDNVAKLIS